MMQPNNLKERMFVVLILAALLLNGCGIIYTDIEVPRAYRSATPIDVVSTAY